ncbi:hypothetical protein R1T08_17360 [Streptomyces sp. SBC-4]|nr:hypothetical protein [Streptomyces sp. SBC-4]MDV5145930.1 hypothetical protein [Streptomyces sp. SBC-4]
MTTYNVTSPDEKFSGESCGVFFTEGAGVVSDETKSGRQAIEYFRRRGYGLVPVSSEDPSADEGPAEGRAFDPAAHDAAEVIDHLDSLDTDDPEQAAEFARVIDAERAGKARKTVLALAEEG